MGVPKALGEGGQDRHPRTSTHAEGHSEEEFSTQGPPSRNLHTSGPTQTWPGMQDEAKTRPHDQMALDPYN